MRILGFRVITGVANCHLLDFTLNKTFTTLFDSILNALFDALNVIFTLFGRVDLCYVKSLYQKLRISQRIAIQTLLFSTVIPKL